MKIDESFDELFDDWKNSSLEYKDNFCCDGIIDIDRWNEAPKNKRILLVLKETNDHPGDLRSLIRDTWGGARHQVWRNVGRWVYGIQNTNALSIPSLSEAEIEKNIDNALLSAAVLNLKKKPGDSNSDDDEIMKYALNDACFIKRELKLIDPNVIICGNTFKALIEAIHPENMSRSEDGLFNVWGDKTIINYWHPAARYPTVMMYYTLLSIYQRGLKERVVRQASS